MAITETQSSSARADTADKAPTASWDNTPTAGNLGICLIGWSEKKGDATVSLSGWTQVPTDGDVNLAGKVRLALFYKTIVAGEASKVKASLNAARRWTIELVEVNNSSSAAGWVVDVSAHSSGSSATPASGTTLTTGTAVEYQVAGFAAQSKATLSSPTNSFAIKEQQVPGSQDAEHVSGVLLSRITAGTGTAASGGTYDKSRPWVGVVATFYTLVKTVTGGATLSGTGSLTASPYYSTAALVVQAAFGYGPGDPNPVFTDITAYARSCQWQRGRQNELNQTQAGTATVVLNDEDSHFDPNNIGTAYSEAVIADAPRAYWHLDELAGPLLDASGNSHPASAVGGVTRGVPGALNDGRLAIALDGTTGYLTVSDHADLDLADVFTLECWVKTIDYTHTQGLIAKGAGGYFMRLKTGSGHVKLNLLKEGATDICTATVQLPEDGAWHHLAATKTGATVKLYQDGVDVTGAVTNATCADTANEIRIGTDYSGTPGAVYNGALDDIAVYPTALSAARIAAHYAARDAGSPFYPHVKPGLPVRAMLFVGGDVYPLFYGFAERLPRTSRVTSVYTQRQLELVDGFALLANAGLGGKSYDVEVSDERITNVLDDIAWSNTARQIGAGVSPIQDVAFPEDDDTRAQSHLQQVADSENGLLFCDGAGTLVFVGRHELIGDTAYTVPEAVFGDVEVGSALVGYGAGGYGAGGYGGGTGTPVYAYTDLEPSYDLDNVFNKWVITPTDLEPQIWEDAASQEDYFLRVKQQASLVTTTGEALNQAQWKSGQFSQPLNRVESITIMPLTDLTDADRIAAGLGREVGDRITVKETPPGFGVVQAADYTIQHVNGQINTGPYVSAKLTFLLWPASTTSFWIVGDPDQSLVGVSSKPGY